MDPTTVKTLETQTVSSIETLYFNSLNDTNTRKLHIIQEKHAGIEEIKQDFRTWYGGFTACAKLLGTNTSQLPMLESLLQTVTKTFPDKAKIAA